MSTLNFYQNNVRSYLLNLLIRNTDFLSDSEKSFQSAPFADHNLTNASAAGIKLNVIDISQLPAITHTDYLLLAKIIQIHFRPHMLFLSLYAFFSNRFPNIITGCEFSQPSLLSLSILSDVLWHIPPESGCDSYSHISALSIYRNVQAFPAHSLNLRRSPPNALQMNV